MTGIAPLSTLSISTLYSGLKWADTVAQSRLVFIPGVNRILLVPAEPEYTITIPAEQRTIKVPASRDSLTIGEPT